MPDFLDEKKREIRDRLKELRPLVDEARRLEAALQALDGVPADGPAAGRSESSSKPTRRSSRSSSSSSTKGSGSGSGSGSGTGKRGRPKGSGPRAQEAMELVRTRPGITIPELAEAMDIQQNYLYRVLPGLQKEGKVRKEGRGWHPMETAPEPTAATEAETEAPAES